MLQSSIYCLPRLFIAVIIIVCQQRGRPHQQHGRSTWTMLYDGPCSRRSCSCCDWMRKVLWLSVDSRYARLSPFVSLFFFQSKADEVTLHGVYKNEKKNKIQNEP